MNGDGGAKVSAKAGVKDPREDEYALTPEDVKNGWTLESKAAYIRECEDYASAIILPERKALPTIENATDFDPHRWAKRS